MLRPYIRLVNQDATEKELGSDLLELRNKILRAGGALPAMGRLSLLLRKNRPQSLSEIQSAQVSRMFALYAWGLRLANTDHEKLVMPALTTAFAYARGNESRGLYYYVMAYVHLENSNCVDAERQAPHAIDYFLENDALRGHCYALIASIHLRQKNIPDAVQYLKLAAALQEAEISRSVVSNIIHHNHDKLANRVQQIHDEISLVLNFTKKPRQTVQPAPRHQHLPVLIWLAQAQFAVGNRSSALGFFQTVTSVAKQLTPEISAEFTQEIEQLGRHLQEREAFDP